jgi:hypothetical protein
MTYERADLTINLYCKMAGWEWFLVDGQGDVIRYGACGDIHDAVNEARQAFDFALAGKIEALP